MRGYEDRREQYSQIITAAQWRFHHQRLSGPQITTFISHYPAPTRWRTSHPNGLPVTWNTYAHLCSMQTLRHLHCRYANQLICSCVLPPQKNPPKNNTAGCFVWGYSTLLEMCLGICLSHLRQRFLQEGTWGGGLVALKSACLTNCRSSAESVAQRDAASSAAGFDTAACGRLGMRHEAKARQKEDLHPTRETLWSVAI